AYASEPVCSKGSGASPGKAQEDGGPAGGTRLLLIAGRRPVGRALAPVAGASREPDESGMRGRMLQHPDKITGIVSGKAQLGAFRHDLGQAVQCGLGDETALVVPLLWPGIRKQDENPADRSWRQRLDQQPGVIGEQADVVQSAPLDLAEQFGD